MKHYPVNFCQVCGHALTDRMAHGKQRRVCPDCGFIHFQDPKVAAVVFIEQDNRVLLVRRAINPERGKWTLPAGYVDYGENPRAAAIREAWEETGLEVEITRLIGVESDPGTFGASIMIVYAARVVNGDAQAGDDADAIRWLAATDPLPELAFHTTQNLVTAWRQGQD
ncbi:MAG: NUDIX hydrolase [Chloroflexi bacterium]|nr:NUDIX hydrolase [Chloroflexota bacterium]